MTEAELIRQVWDLCQKILGPRYRLFLFGSRAQKKNNAYSDFDFFVCGDTEVKEKDWFRLLNAVEEIQTLHKIDLVDYMAASEDLKKVAGKSLKEIINGQIRRESGTSPV